MSVNPGSNAILNTPIDKTAPPGPLFIAEHNAATETLHNSAKRHLVRSIDEIKPNGIFSGSNIPYALKSIASTASRSSAKSEFKYDFKENEPEADFQFFERSSVPRGAVTKAPVITIRQIRSTVRCFTGKKGRIPDSCSQLLR